MKRRRFLGCSNAGLQVAEVLSITLVLLPTPKNDQGGRRKALKLEKTRALKSDATNFLSHRTPKGWKKLQEVVVTSPTVVQFKISLDGAWPLIFPAVPG